METTQRVEQLEQKVAELLERVGLLEGKKLEQNNDDFHRNIVSDYMIKVVYPGIFGEGKTPTAGFPSNRRKVAQQLQPGQKMFLYATSPERKIIGLAEVVSECTEVGGRWPYSVDLKWLVGPKPGVKFIDVDLDIRPRIGDTLFAITEEKANKIIDKLNEQNDLDEGTLEYLADKYSNL